jgi:hypothetical protein
MPFIITKTNTRITTEQENNLKQGLGKAIEYVPGKSEQALMLDFEERSHLYIRGDNSIPMAYIDVSIFGNPNHDGYAELSQAITILFNKVLKIEPENIFIDYKDIPIWGVNGWAFEQPKEE